ncbi:F-box/kelch-repeat protein At3g23880-like [Bidens hawaiensis]|uniref:F-box/kelch-repeat protein At3g23880-like n=1 Tax=Bidens hawaiensis TaxID=980011 RepID=UPI004049E416
MDAIPMATLKAHVVDDDVAEQILIRLDAKDLNRYKRVCKSWLSLITSTRFVSRHLNHSYNKDRYSNKLGHRRVSVFGNHHRLVGSSNGLVCICSLRSNLIVHNPMTREVRQLPYLPYICRPLCWGFGYDSLRDDYKVIVGARRDDKQTCFRLLSLKSNVWRDVGDENYNCFINEVGVLYNGALHWIVVDRNQKTLIVSFALSREEFKEIPQPDNDARYKCTWSSYPGIMKECLCVFGFCCGVWLMKKYHVKESWELVEIPYDDMKYDILRLGYPFVNDPKPDRTLEHRCWEYPAAPVFIKSLVSPHALEVAIESKFDLIVSVLKEKLDLGESNEQIQEVVERKFLGAPELEKSLIEQIQEAVNELVAIVIGKEDLDGPNLENNQASPWFRMMKLQSTLRLMMRQRGRQS